MWTLRGHVVSIDSTHDRTMLAHLQEETTVLRANRFSPINCPARRFNPHGSSDGASQLESSDHVRERAIIVCSLSGVRLYIRRAARSSRPISGSIVVYTKYSEHIPMQTRTRDAVRYHQRHQRDERAQLACARSAVAQSLACV